ncbi:MAG: hypothetical protein LBL91_05890 [Lachnospiraceae bacterium]|jgi:hypothetical protein|nr:hypothetical protein [Lachnospiraceae bacterium]
MKKSLSNSRTSTVEAITSTTYTVGIFVGVPQGHNLVIPKAESFVGTTNTAVNADVEVMTKMAPKNRILQKQPEGYNKGRLRPCDVALTVKAEAPVMYYEKGYNKGEIHPYSAAPTAQAEDDEQSIPESSPKWWENLGNWYNSFTPRTARYKRNTSHKTGENDKKRKAIDNYYEALQKEGLKEWYSSIQVKVQDPPDTLKRDYLDTIAEEDRGHLSKKKFRDMWDMSFDDWGFKEE